MNDVVIIESVTEAGTEWLVSFDGPNPDDDKCIRVANAEEAAKLKRLVDAAKVAPLAAMLDRLGGDGAYHALNGHDVATVADSMFAFSQWLEARARCDALASMAATALVRAARCSRIATARSMGPMTGDQKAIAANAGNAQDAAGEETT